MTSSPSTHLDYASSAPIRRRRRVRRVVGTLLVIAVMLAGWRWGPATWARARYLYVQHQCLTYAPAADQLVFDTGMESLRGPDDGPPLPHAKKFFQRPAPPPLVAYSGVPMFLRTTFVQPVLFMHERRTPAGERRLVVVTLEDPTVTTLSLDGELHVRTITPATWRTDAIDRDTSHGMAVSDDWSPLRIYAGQSDPNDPTHFTVRYNEDNDRMILHGRLREDGVVDFSRETLPAGSPVDK